MSLVYRFSRCDTPVRTAGNPRIDAAKQQIVCVTNWSSSAFKLMGHVHKAAQTNF
jgi:hypothetical protein